MKNLFIKSITCFLLLSSTTLLWQCSSDSSNWVFKIDGKKYTENDLNSAYNGLISLVEMQLGGTVTKEQLLEYIEAPEKASDPMMQQQLRGLQKENFLETYKQLILMQTEAEKSGFTDKKEVKSIMAMQNLQMLGNLYTFEKVDPASISISEADATSYLEELRKQRPEVKRIPITQALELAKQQIMQQEIQKRRLMLRTEITESNQIIKNDEFSWSAKKTDPAETKTDKQEAEAEE